MRPSRPISRPRPCPATGWPRRRSAGDWSTPASTVWTRAWRATATRSCGGSADYNIPEDFPLADLVRIIRRFANGDGGSVCTVTVADPATLAAAQKDPDSYNLVRVRMGGWTEFFVTLFPDHQEQHKRRPHYA